MTKKPDDHLPKAAPCLEDLCTEQLNALKAHARQLMAGERANHTLQPTALVNEAFLRVHQNAEKHAPQNSREFHLQMVRSMRQLLTDHARRKRAAKRDGGGKRVADDWLEEILIAQPDGASIDEERLAAALERLERTMPRAHAAIRLIFINGLSYAAVASALGTSDDTVGRDLTEAKALLREALRDGASDRGC